MPALLSRREGIAWLAAFALVAALIVSTKFTSHDADSVRYATISARLSELPVARWVAPEWWGLSPDNPLTGYFLEHPAGLFLIPAALGRLGIPAEQAPYIFGVAAGLIAVLMLAALVARLATREHGRAALVLLQVMPIAFVFRVRDNHEYPMLVCLLATVTGLEGLSRSWMWVLLVIAGIAGGVLVKGVFVVLVLLAAGLWIVVNPTRGARARQVAGVAVALLASAAIAYAYDVWYARVTGGPFWSAYWARQMGPLEVASPLGQATAFLSHIGFYLARLALHPAPWSLALVWALLRPPYVGRAFRPGVQGGPEGPPYVRGLWFVLTFASISVLALSLSGRFAERYLFSTTYLVAAAGVVAAIGVWPFIPRALDRLERRVPALPIVVWGVLVAMRLLLGDWLPRI